jgi:hypothetical protein
MVLKIGKQWNFNGILFLGKCYHYNIGTGVNTLDDGKKYANLELSSENI